MLGLAFFGDRSSFLRNREKDGHHLHEAPKVMWLPYTILAIASLAIGLVGPWAETFLHNSLEHYLGEFGLHTLEKSFSINTFALGGSVLALIVGGGLAYYIYIARRVDPAKIVSSNIILRGLYRFLENRWYLNTLFYGIFVDGSIKTARGLSKNVELSIIDKISGTTAFGSVTFSRASNWFDRNIVDGIINRIRTVGVKLSITSRLIQTGTTENYILAFTVGIIIVVLVLLMQPVLLIV
jgi:NADH-quinone oxidoreductase subunit L